MCVSVSVIDFLGINFTANKATLGTYLSTQNKDNTAFLCLIDGKKKLTCIVSRISRNYSMLVTECSDVIKHIPSTSPAVQDVNVLLAPLVDK